LALDIQLAMWIIVTIVISCNTKHRITAITDTTITNRKNTIQKTNIITKNLTVDMINIMTIIVMNPEEIIAITGIGIIDIIDN
jgi:transcriptional regulatory protein LevR